MEPDEDDPFLFVGSVRVVEGTVHEHISEDIGLLAARILVASTNALLHKQFVQPCY